MIDFDFTKKYHSKKDFKPSKYFPIREHWTEEEYHKLWAGAWDKKMDELRQEWLDDEAKILFGDYPWRKAGYDESGRLIQYNTETKEYRTLDKWFEIFKTEEIKEEK